MVHRLVALAILAAVAFSAWAARRQTGAKSRLSCGVMLWLGLVCAQALLGAATIWSDKAADIATAHVLGGALSLALGGMLSLISYEKLRPVYPQKPVKAPRGLAAENMAPARQQAATPQFRPV
jgi:cytochrome c oxidase assembly protein subunit 15